MRSFPKILLKFPLIGSAAVAALFLTPGGPGFVPAVWAQVDDGRVEILTRGPIHEAFAVTISFKPTPGVLVSKAPPVAIEEIPPDQRPEGDDISWIPGYWAWDDEATDFLWVSGIWRNIPPGRQWIPGYWSEAGQDYQWIPGYWADAAVAEVDYLDEPPASLEAGPNVASPSRNHQWIPGTWRWSESRYAWQGGYWDEPQPDWVWVPSYYSMTPRGYIYVDGYYDYDFGRRGVLFAPVRFQGDGYRSRDYRYRPTTVISITALVNHLFLRPRSRHYYFGDYYAPRYRESGYFASYNYYSGGHGYDPIYAHQRWTHRDDDGWQRRYEENYSYYRDHEDARPPHTLAAFTTWLALPAAHRRVESDYATRLDRYVEGKDSRIRFRQVSETEQNTYVRRGREIREFGEERRKLGGRKENPDRDQPGQGGQKPDKRGGEPGPGKLPKSPIAAKPDDFRDKSEAPPQRPKGGRADGRTGGGGKEVDPRAPQPKGDKSDRGSGGKPKEDREGRPGVEPRGKPESPPRPDPSRENQRMPDIQPRDKAKEMPKAQPGGKAKEMPEPGRNTDDERPADPDRKSDSRKEPRNPGQPDSKGQPQRNPDDRTPRREPAAEPRPEPERDGAREPRTEPKRDSKPEPKREPQPEPKRDSVPEPRAAPKREKNPEPQREPKAEPRRETREQPRAEPRREPNPEPKREPKAEPRREPKEEPRREAPAPQPKAELKRAPKAPPQSKPSQVPQAPPASPSGKKEDGSDEKQDKDKKGKG